MPYPHARRFRRALVATAAAVVLGSTMAACTPEQDRASAVVLINEERAAHGLAAVSWNDELGHKAQEWAEHLADTNTLGHSVLTAGVSPGWRALGENVGYGDTVLTVHDRFMESTAHRDAILNGVYRGIGIGVAMRGSRIFVVEVFKA